LSNRRVHIAALATLALILSLFGGNGLAGASSPTKHVVAARYNGLLERKVLTTTKGLTLYSLGIERNGKLACLGTCLQVWHPLLIGAGKKPTGPVKLGTVKRPDRGKPQVTYRGMPLYTFSGDGVPGQTNGNGVTDVGIWHAATVPSSG
jgi:predicted lipoprotein with Yx(FWY)xxD motif